MSSEDATHPLDLSERPVVLPIVRSAFARQMLALAGLVDARVEAAMASVAREDFLPPPPWHARLVSSGLQALASDDPVALYQDVVLALSPDQGINNGSPSLHAVMLSRLAVPDGGRVVHLGAGSGYYTAILAHLAGPRGEVVAVEFDERLAAMARRNLAGLPNVRVEHGNAFDFPRQGCDCIYVNFAVSRPAGRWLEALAPDGRLVLPLSVPAAKEPGQTFTASELGAVYMIQRVPQGWAAEWLSPACFIWAAGEATLDDSRPALRDAFERGGAELVRSLQWGTPAAPARCWFWSPEWSLSLDPAPG